MWALLYYVFLNITSSQSNRVFILWAIATRLLTSRFIVAAPPKRRVIICFSASHLLCSLSSTLRSLLESHPWALNLNHFIGGGTVCVCRRGRGVIADGAKRRGAKKDTEIYMWRTNETFKMHKEDQCTPSRQCVKTCQRLISSPTSGSSPSPPPPMHHTSPILPLPASIGHNLWLLCQ